MKNIQIYLAGKMSGLTFKEQNEYREEIKNSLIRASQFTYAKVIVVNPVDYYNFENPRHQTEEEIMKFDLSKVKHSDLIVVNLDGLMTSIGSIIEVYEAYKSDIPVIAYDVTGQYENLHPWLQTCITRVEKNIDSLSEYIRDFYFI